jgi:hypothetical protein
MVARPVINYITLLGGSAAIRAATTTGAWRDARSLSDYVRWTGWVLRAVDVDGIVDVGHYTVADVRQEDVRDRDAEDQDADDEHDGTSVVSEAVS